MFAVMFTVMFALMFTAMSVAMEVTDQIAFETRGIEVAVTISTVWPANIDPGTITRNSIYFCMTVDEGMTTLLTIGNTNDPHDLRLSEVAKPDTAQSSAQDHAPRRR